jgi:ABC-type multidrug transport system permease subunit
MYNTRHLVAAFTISEYPFIALGAMIFVICFYFLVGFAISFGRQFAFDNVKLDMVYLVGVTLGVCMITHILLNRLNFLSN